MNAIESKIGRARQADWRFTERSRGDASDTDGKPEGVNLAGASESNALQFLSNLRIFRSNEAVGEV